MRLPEDGTPTSTVEGLRRILAVGALLGAIGLVGACDGPKVIDGKPITDPLAPNMVRIECGMDQGLLELLLEDLNFKPPEC